MLSTDSDDLVLCATTRLARRVPGMVIGVAIIWCPPGPNTANSERHSSCGRARGRLVVIPSAGARRRIRRRSGPLGLAHPSSPRTRPFPGCVRRVVDPDRPRCITRSPRAAEEADSRNDSLRPCGDRTLESSWTRCRRQRGYRHARDRHCQDGASRHSSPRRLSRRERTRSPGSLPGQS